MKPVTAPDRTKDKRYWSEFEERTLAHVQNPKCLTQRQGDRRHRLNKKISSMRRVQQFNRPKIREKTLLSRNTNNGIRAWQKPKTERVSKSRCLRHKERQRLAVLRLPE
jgi:hypothetical protein